MPLPLFLRKLLENATLNVCKSGSHGLQEWGGLLEEDESVREAARCQAQEAAFSMNQVDGADECRETRNKRDVMNSLRFPIAGQ